MILIGIIAAVLFIPFFIGWIPITPQAQVKRRQRSEPEQVTVEVAPPQQSA